MSAPPRLKSVAREATPDAPGWWDRILTLLNPFLTDVQGCLDKGLTRRENMRGDFTEIEFTTSATLADTWPISAKHTMKTRPMACWHGDVKRVDGATIDNPFSMTFRLGASNLLELTFQGLAASTKYRAVILYE